MRCRCGTLDGPGPLPCDAVVRRCLFCLVLALPLVGQDPVADELLFPMLVTRGELLVANRDWRAALPVLRRAIEVGSQLGVEGHHSLHAARDALASACWQLGERQAAIAALGANLDWFGGHLEQVLPALAEVDRLRTVALHRAAVDRLLVWTAEQPALLPMAEVYARVLAWKGQVARGVLDEPRAALPDAEGAARLRRLQQIVGEIAMGRADDTLRAERESLVAAVGRGATASVAPSVAAVQSALPYRAALVDFVLLHEPGGGRRYIAFVLRGRHVRRVDLGPAEPIEQSVREWLQLLARSMKPGVQGVAAPVGRELRQRVFEPLAAAIGDSVRLFVCPDAALATLPFETLPDGDGAAFLVERLSISYLQDATELMRTPMEDPGTTLLAFGDIDYGASSATSSVQRGVPRPFAPLPATANELAVFERLPDIVTTVVRGKAASEQRLRESVAGAAFVHLATHAFCGVAGAAEPQAMRAGVALASANDAPGADDGIVGVDEAARLDLRNCRLAVLSACQTGLGEPFAGESLLGLRRALRIAGAKATVTSLWRVDDAATAQLMADFYTTLFGDERDPALALREAQLQALARARAAHGGEGLPGLWGAFVTEGR